MCNTRAAPCFLSHVSRCGKFARALSLINVSAGVFPPIRYAKPSNKGNPGKSHEAYLDPTVPYSQNTLTSLALVDEDQINYDLLAVLIA